MFILFLSRVIPDSWDKILVQSTIHNTPTLSARQYKQSECRLEILSYVLLNVEFVKVVQIRFFKEAYG